jgi:fructose-bisphosphate aldolase class 1
MVRQGFKQDARRRVTEALSAQRKERLEQERRLAGLAVDILTTIAERDEAVQSAEQQAADAVRALLAEHLSITEIADLCGGQIDAKELARLSRIPPVPASAAGMKS